MRRKSSTSTSENLYRRMLDNIKLGQWPVGSAIPSERVLIDQFGVSRISVREALSMLRGLGVVETSHGRGTRVRQIDAQVLDQLLPSMLATGGQRTFKQIFDVRLALESRAAYIAATMRTAEQMERIEALAEAFRKQSAMTGASPAVALKTDLEFHLEISRATGNPLFSILLEALSRFVLFGQIESCKNDPKRRKRAIEAHAAIAEAIANSDAERARAEMESHLLYSAARIVDSMQDPTS